jgi:hypothetical protein
MEPEELIGIAQGFWRGLTDGKGLEGLLGFSPNEAISGALEKALSERPPADGGRGPADPTREDDPASATDGSDPGPLT